MHAPDLAGRTVLVTGSARGLGRGLALSLADCGAAVAIHYHTSADAADEAAAEARALGAPAVTTVRGDVTSPDAVDHIFDTVEADLGPVDVLVNNVGAFAPTHWTEIDADTWHTVLDTNLTAPFLTAKRALPGMRARSWGRIVNVGYASAEKGLVNPTNFPYFAAKQGLLMFTRMLAADTQDDGITANAVSPYVVQNSDEFPADAPRGRWATVEDIAGVVRFFCDADSGYVSGENVNVDGGWLPEHV
ncbi:SDR family NAD(P)-dependent oxidoreductase [Halobacterium salinarum]|uniref:Oxidoreductase n=3 Tax=Halobacterium salinarum TaxID=2242 RepID=Q9HMA5_HALSA|nr:SDR family oxidoreductase [Halobacterium salinarum]AAG20666.1 oxidoreductase [Halobacterium salinarum NRC-1]MBB6089397.1 NAD(P)-dependent dehydrogenase (short-subunit alcohol dehydrogenase family) [Halobacterium salinarum]MDL0121183.1 SDR family oxidoreductase [Halobacterium salinarum]MDL0124826.1 SDR family oxidoreductase [Halobacterium salinarum]MDL0126595.1 SDR family oxidoreductase [Halobacterium salinarum]